MTTAPSSKSFTRSINSYQFNRHPQYLYTDTVYLLRPPRSLSSDRPWIINPTTTARGVVLRHPLTSDPYLCNLPRYFDFSKLHPSAIAVSYQFPAADKLVVVPDPLLNSRYNVDVRQCTLLALCGGGELWGCPAVDVTASSPWVRLSPSDKLDDIAVFRGRIYAVNRRGIVKLINNHKATRMINIGITVIFQPVTPTSGRFGSRKRLVVDDNFLYLVVRMEEKVLRVFVLQKRERELYWKEVWGFKGEKVLFMARDYYFFQRASRKFPGREYRNCIVFHEAAFPQYGNDCWDFSQFTERRDQFGVSRRYDDDIAVFRLNDKCFAREGENSGFPKINWSPPAWIFKASAVPVPADEFQCYSAASVSSCQLERELDEAKGLDSINRDENDGEVQSDLKVSNSKDKDKQEEMESEFGNQDQRGVESDSDRQNQTAETSGKNITSATPKALTSSITEIYKTDSPPTKFEGLDIRSDLIPTLQKIWRKHGNIIKYSIVRNSDIIAKALESLATMVRILEDNSPQSLSDSQADYLSSTLPDLRCIGFRVDWLACFIEKALKVHTSKGKGLLESLNNLRQSRSKVKDRKIILRDELTKLNDEENKLKEEMAKVSKMIPFYGQAKFDEPIGVGLT
ncbi:uncharacterized protein LOC141610880 [Silene latifolia]|uniref:uncharacterized protein LOC141610880 n=1 Tax=Silene latifolia TaxID=37657 RepID=UPI003D77CD99